jgi:hypothetical protein
VVRHPQFINVGKNPQAVPIISCDGSELLRLCVGDPRSKHGAMLRVRPRDAIDIGWQCSGSGNIKLR